MQKELKIFDIAIIGAGPAGLFAAFEAGAQDFCACIIDSLEIPGGQCAVLYPEKAIYDIPGHIKISGQELTNNLFQQAKRFERNEFIFGGNVLEYEKDFEKNIFILKIEINRIEKKEIIEIFARTVVISTGCGAFIPNKPATTNLECFEDSDKVHYLVKDINIYSGKTIAIAGGGDSAVDWALCLSAVAEKIFFIHRRVNLRCHPCSLNQLYEIEKTKKIEFKIPYVANALEKQDGNSERITLKLQNFDNEESTAGENISIDYFLAFFGLKNEIGPIGKWPVEFNSKNKIIVSPFMQTNIKGIFGIGDICEYQGKTKLLVSCFHEACVAINSITTYLVENHGYKKPSFSYSTTKFQ